MELQNKKVLVVGSGKAGSAQHIFWQRQERFLYCLTATSS